MMLLFFIGFLSGVISGMGIGGGTILIPALTLFFNFDQKLAQNVNLIYFIPTAIIAILTHFKNGNLEIQGLWKIITFGLIGALIGSLIATNLNSAILRKIFGWFLLIMGSLEIFKKGKDRENGKKQI